MNPQTQALGSIDGYGHHSIINMANAISVPGVSTSGTINTNGTLQSGLTLAAGQSLKITQRDGVAIADIIYDRAHTAGTLEIRSIIGPGGTPSVKKTVVVASGGTGLVNTFLTYVNGGAPLRMSDTIEFYCTSGSFDLRTFLMIKANPTPLPNNFMAVMAQSGFAWQDYGTPSALAEWYFYASQLVTGVPVVDFLACTTNNMVNSAKALTPANTVSAANGVISGRRALVTTGSYLPVIVMPPPTTASIILSGYAEADYVNALLSYASTNNIPVIRFDQMPIARLIADGIHMDVDMQRIARHTALRHLGDEFYFRGLREDDTVTLSAPWVSYGVSYPEFKPRCQREGTFVSMTGRAFYNAAGPYAAVIGSLPTAYAPDVMERVVQVGLPTGGTTRLKIDTNGLMTLLDTPTPGDICFDGVSFRMRTAPY